MKISELFGALQRGNSLPHAAQWKWSGVVALALVLLMQASRALGWVPPEVTDDAVLELVGALYALYTQVATTEKIGV